MQVTQETGPKMAAKIQEAAPRIQGKEASELLATLNETADFKGMSAARNALEIVAINLAAKVSKTSLAHIFGGPRRNTIALDGPIGLLSNEEALRKAETLVHQGVRTLKVKSGFNAKADADRIARLHERFGSQIQLRTDANGGFSPDEALRFTDDMLKIGLEHFEQPVLPKEKKCIELFREIRARGMKGAVDESLFSIDDAYHIVDEEAADVALIKFSKFGGTKNAWNMARVFDAAGKTAILKFAL